MSISSMIKARSASLLFTRDSEAAMSSTMIDLLIALLVLIFISLLLCGTLYFIRKLRRSRAISRQQLPTYSESTSTNPNRPISHHRRLTITTSPYNRNSSNIYVYDEKSSMLDSPTTPSSPVPEIRITFPDEQDESGRPKSGRVVIVRVGENGVGLEPVQDEQLPAYQKESGERFHSIDMERIGGLKEKSQYS